MAIFITDKTGIRYEEEHPVSEGAYKRLASRLAMIRLGKVPGVDAGSAKIVTDDSIKIANSSVYSQSPLLPNRAPMVKPPMPAPRLEPGDWIWCKPGYVLVKMRDRKAYWRDYSRKKRARVKS